ncbi:HD domain-containing protein [Enterococcus timonensis]|uniref:HD domain-containing protein n=1 Tax=Enterococcus timonensis TaxID=1852364 RepID=UPI0008D975BF|nr:hypothetical protein [Enterococcus timonensis]
MEEVAVKQWVADFFSDDHSGHDLDHIERVVKTATYLAKEERLSAEEITNIRLLAYLHEMLDHKFFPDQNAAEKNLETFLNEQGVGLVSQMVWAEAISQISFSKRGDNNDVPFWVKIVQDADLLDAIGAIGIARTFMYGATRGSKMYDPISAGVKDSSIIQHFYDKLLTIIDLLETDAAKKLGAKRQMMMEDFLQAFYEEWEGH